MKRILSMIVTLALVIACLPVFPLEVHAVTIASGECGDNVTWTLDDTGTLTISGTGPMDDCDKYTADSSGNSVISRPWRQYSNQVKSAVIEDGVTYIGTNAFLQDSNLKSVKIADSVTEIGSFAFKECSSLTSISFGSGLEKTGTDVFLRCTSLKSVVLPNNDVDYGNNLFKGCSSLTNVTIPETQTTLGESMFSGCTNLTDITIPNSVTKIKGSAFQSSGLKSVHIPESVTVIDQYAFRYCENLEEVVIPSSVKTLGIGVFNNCLNLKKLTLSEGLETIDGYLITNSSNVTEITIPSTVTSLTNTFSEAYGLKVIKFKGNYPQCSRNTFDNCELTAYYPENNSTWTEDVLQNYGGNITWVAYEAKAEIIASGECGDNATWTLDDAGTLTISGTGGLMIFNNYNDPWKEYRSSIKKVVMHEGITAINHNAFAGCKNLISVELPKSLWGIGPYAFSGCSSLPEIEIPDAVHLICENAFLNCTSLTSVVIPDSVTSLEGSAFAHCTSLTDVTIGNSVTTIGPGAFNGCTSLTSIEIPDSVTTIESNTFRDCTSLTDVTIGNSVTTIGTYAFINCTSLTNVTIGSSVTTIGGGAFRCCSSLNNVVIPDSVTDLGGGAFYKCSSLSNVVMPDSVTNMGFGVFEGCTSLTELPLSSSIDSIIQGMFDGCTGLTNVVIPDFITKIGAGAFRDCTGLTSITISNSVTEIIDGAFSGCTALAEVTIPASVIEIENHAFYNCTGLKKITFEGDAPRIYSDIFHNVTATAYYPANAVTWTEEARQNYGGTITWVPYGEAVAVIASGTCGVSANWILDETGRLTIFGTSNTYGYKSSSEMPWYPYFSSIKSVDIKDGITTLGSYSFAGCTSLTSVTCSDTLRNIESAAFAGCTNLTSVTFGDSLERLYGLTFQGCTSLTEITIPDRVTSIGGSTFADCTNLKSVTLGNSLTGISSFLFANCTSLTGVTIPGTVTEINQSAFAGCTGLTSISIPNSVELIRDDAFTGCTNLSEIIFAGCAPEFIVKEGDGIFYNVTATAYYPSVMPDWKKDMLQNYGGNITWVPYESEDILIGSGSCGDDVTWKLDTTGTLTVSGTGDIYHYSATDRIPWYYDRLCIRTVVIEHGVTNICANAFDNCDNMTSVTIPDSVTRFGDSAFSDCNKLASVTIPDSVTQIPWYSFYGCNSLTTLVIPDSVTYIGPSAFQYCTGLTSLTIGNSLKEVAGFQNCSSLTDVTFGNSVESIKSIAFKSCTALKNITIPNTVKKIGYEAFMHCLKLTSVTIGSSVETIEAKAFYGCESLTEIIFLGDAPTFGWSQTENEGAFKYVTATAYYPADNDTWTEEVRNSTDGQIIWIPYDAGPKTIASGTCGANLTWTLTEDGTLTISGTGAMDNGQTPAWAEYADSINSVVVEDGVTSICDKAFLGCGNLNQIIFKGSAPTIGDSAFGNVTAIAYYYPDETWTEAVLQNYGGTITWSAVEKGKLLLSGEEFASQDTVWIEGLPYPIQGEGNDRYVELPTEDDCYMVTYTYHTGDASDIHTQYPTGMKVYKVSDGEITHIPQLDNLLQYSGASIRITGKKGIRMITSLTKTNKTALTGKGLAGFKLLEYGTALCFASEIQEGDALVLGRDFTRSNYAYKKGVADPVFASTKDLIQYTNVLVGFSLDQCKDDIAMRPYIILEDAAGNQITLYGGTIYRSIGYIAYQNRTVFKPKTASYNYVWEIIHHVYGDKYDADYKG